MENLAYKNAEFYVPQVDSQDMFEGLLPQTVMEQEFQQSNAENQPSNQHDVGPHDVEEVVQEEESKIRKERVVPKWVQSTLWDSNMLRAVGYSNSD